MSKKQTLKLLFSTLMACWFTISGFTQNFQVGLTGVDPSCAGFTNGSVTANPTGGWPPYTFQWNTGSTDLQLAGVGAGTYTVTVIDVDGAIATGSFTLNDPPAIVATINNSNGNCSTVGTLTVNATGGDGNYTYLWSTGATTPSINTTVADLYCVTVTDGAGCAVVECLTLSQTFSVDVVTVDSPCFMLCDGSATAVVTGGQAPYSYLWNTGSNDPAIFPLPAGTYTVTVTDQNGCTASASGVINEPTEIIPTVTINAPACGTNNGSASVSATGGTPPYQYTWSTGATGPSVNNLDAGSYFVVIVDANNCRKEETFTIGNQNAFTVNLNPSDPSCAAPNSGAINTTISGGTPPFSYNWSNGSTNQNLSGLAGGTFSVTVTDNAGCQGVASTTLTAASTISVAVSAINPSGCNTGNGSASASVAGNSGPVTYSWSNGATGATISNLGGGTYSVTVTETATGCSATGSVNLTEPSGFTIMVTAVNVTCNGNGDGTASAIVTGGTPPFNFSWSNGANTASISSLQPGTYGVTVTDANNCQQVGAATINEPAPLNLTLNTTDPSGCGTANGTVQAQISGNTGPFTYLWSTGATSAQLTNLSGGNYSVTVTETATGCTVTGSTTLNGSAGFTLQVNTTDVTCHGNADGSATALVTGGVTPFIYNWSNGGTANSINGLAGGNYSVTVIDGSGCEQVETVLVNEPAALACTVTGNDPSAFGANDGNASVTVTGGTTNYSYNWSNGATNSSISGLGGGTFTVTVTDANGCTTTCSTTLTEPTPSQPTAKLGNLVWEDLNEDGIFQPGEPGVEGIQVDLSGTDVDGNPVTGTTTTDATGMYMFGDLPAGDYKVTFTIPNNFLFTTQDAGTDDAFDSDVDPTMGMTPVTTLADGEVNLTLDAGLVCANVLTPGTIAADQTLCGPGNVPATLTEVTPATGPGPFEYIWMRSNTRGAFTNGTWSIIPGSTGRNYSPGPIYETTYFARCVRRVGCTKFLETNVITITVDSVAKAEITGPSWICAGDSATFVAADAGPGAVYNWDLGLGASPRFVTGRTATARFPSFGYFDITLTVDANGCTASRVAELVVGCSHPLLLSGDQLNPNTVRLTIEGLSQINEGKVILERSKDGSSFYAFDNFQAADVLTDKHEVLDYNPNPGINYYRIFLEAPDFNNYSQEIMVGVFKENYEVMIYPNPVTSYLQFDVSNLSKRPSQLTIYNTTGVEVYNYDIAETTGTQMIDVSNLPQGIYFAKFLFDGQVVRSFKIVKKNNN